MPSKNRKQSKTPVKLSYSDQSSPSNSIKKIEEEEEDICESILEEASIKYPSLIGKDAVISRITDVESNSGSHAAKIWLSESAMVTASLVPGSIVSVSLASSKRRFLGGFPLQSSIDERDWQHSIDASHNGADDLGNYFALALVYPSSKVSKNGVRLSGSLACTMGNPSLGKITFVFPIQTQSGAVSLKERNTLLCSSIIPDSGFSVCKCKDLQLELIPSEKRVQVNGDSTSEAHCDQLENGKFSSPKTPLLYKSKLSSAVSNTICQDLRANTQDSNETMFNGYNIEEAIGNEKSREVLQTCASLWLHARILLHGNLVAFPMGGQISIFRVQGADQLSTECPSEESANEGILSNNPQTINLDGLNVAFFIDYETKVKIHPSLPLATQVPDNISLPSGKPDWRHTKDKVAGHMLKLGGLSNEYAELKKILPSSRKDPLSGLGLRPTKGVLLFGPPGTGKTSLAHSCVIDAGINLFSIKGPEIIGQFHGESEQALSGIFDSASKALPAVVFIDEVDAIAPARKDGGDELSQRMVATLLNLMDGIGRTDGILIIAASNRPDSIDPALRRPGRLDKEIEIGVPSPMQRLDILNSLLHDLDHSLEDTQIQHLASNAHGFVGADLASLCNEAAMVCLSRHVKSKNSLYSSSVTSHKVQSKEQWIKHDSCSDDSMGSCVLSTVNTHNTTESKSSSLLDLYMLSDTNQSRHPDSEIQQVIIIPQDVDIIDYNVAPKLDEEAVLKVNFDDFERAKRKVRPSAMREVNLEIPKVRWEDVGGQKEVKQQLMEAVEWPQKHQEDIKRIGTRPPTGVLMSGPPGCSKTLMARAVASEAGLNFLSVKGPELFSKWVGESEKAVKSVFAKARANKPSIIFFDEIDGLAVIRGKENDGVSVSDRVISQLLVELDGLDRRDEVTVIAATNRPDKIDPALIRPGRFDRLLYVGPPSESDREEIFHIHVRRMSCNSDVNIKKLAHLTTGYTGADISLICREAALAAIEESLEASEVSMAHFESGLGRVQPSEVRGDEDFYSMFQRHVRIGASIDDRGCKPSSVPCRTGIRCSFAQLLFSLSTPIYNFPLLASNFSFHVP
ncbi:Atp-dependent zinc metalloprotease ftsh [Thalictrum thalictroides]|uniref:Atp-dependent zinc metalloprotease ftsh n=1 Tax=Thalictrum thalictroides TaxID=46969 RepID=A0A7J6W519_THATH|nr:Atp-dependent zinc metalloprotease ftsh [Thalictrum thalictroides]